MVGLVDSRKVVLTCAEATRGKEERGVIVRPPRSRYLRARQGRFSVNLRVIPVISCLENHAVALMLHCLSPLVHRSPLRFVPNCTPYYSQFTPTILTISTAALIPAGPKTIPPRSASSVCPPIAPFSSCESRDQLTPSSLRDTRVFLHDSTSFLRRSYLPLLRSPRSGKRFTIYQQLIRSSALQMADRSGSILPFNLCNFVG